MVGPAQSSSGFLTIADGRASENIQGRKMLREGSETFWAELVEKNCSLLYTISILTLHFWLTPFFLFFFFFKPSFYHLKKLFEKITVFFL